MKEASPARALDWGCRLMERQPEFQRAQRVLEIGGGDFRRVVALAEQYPDKNFISMDSRLETRAHENARRAAVIPNLSIVKCDLLDGLFANEVFDFAFSIAVMEHVPRLEQFLSTIHSVLRPRGAYSYFQAPFWTCKTGHHFRHNDPSVTRVLDSYEHIVFDAEGLRAHLRTIEDLPFDLEECVRKIYERSDLSRLSPTESRRIVDSSRFVVESWEERPDKDFDETKAKVALLAHGARYALDDFRIGAVLARLIKP